MAANTYRIALRFWFPLNMTVALLVAPAVVGVGLALKASPSLIGIAFGVGCAAIYILGARFVRSRAAIDASTVQVPDEITGELTPEQMRGIRRIELALIYWPAVDVAIVLTIQNGGFGRLDGLIGCALVAVSALFPAAMVRKPALRTAALISFAILGVALLISLFEIALGGPPTTVQTTFPNLVQPSSAPLH